MWAINSKSGAAVDRFIMKSRIVHNHDRAASDSGRFIKPLLAVPLVELWQRFSDIYLKIKANLTVCAEPSVYDGFQSIMHCPAIVAGNHPSSEDPFVIFEISKAAGQVCHYLTTRELFTWHPSLRSHWLQLLGCYSVLRAATDVESFRTSLDLLRSGANKIVIFPEGEISLRNEAVMPLEKGIMHLALKAADNEGAATVSVLILPIAMLYRFEEDVEGELISIIQDCEDALGIAYGAGADVVSRTKVCYENMLALIEQSHNLRQPAEFASLAERTQAICRHRIQEMAVQCGVEICSSAPPLANLHKIQNYLTEKRYCEGVEPSELDRRLYAAVKHLTSFCAITDDCFIVPMSQERLAELLQLLHAELTKREFPKIKKRAYVAASDPIDVAPLLSLFRRHRHKAIDVLRTRLSDDMRELLKDLIFRHPSKAMFS